jgi:hypothetical protein
MATMNENWRDAFVALQFVKSRMALGSPISLGVEAVELAFSPLPVGQAIEGLYRPPVPFLPVQNQVQALVKIVQGQIAKQVIKSVQNDSQYTEILNNTRHLPDNAVRELYITQVAHNTYRSYAGNCGEQSALAFTYLRNHGKFPIDLAFWGNSSGKYGGHAFVLLGRAAQSSVTDPRTWGDACVVCDPQKTGKIFESYMIGHYFGTKNYELQVRLEGKTEYTADPEF